MIQNSNAVSPSIQPLFDELANAPPGYIDGAARNKILQLLAICWHEFKGAEDTSMKAWKLDRAERMTWTPPIISFTIERHGSFVLGSTRAEVQEWRIHLYSKTADCISRGFRQLIPSEPKLDVKPIAALVCEAVKLGPASGCDLVKEGIVVWRNDNNVLIKQSVLISGVGFAQTIAGRRRRFRDELTSLMKVLGWQLESYRPTMKFKKES